MKVLITGTNRGIGKATAELFLKHNHEVIGFDIEEASIEHENYKHIICDVSQPDTFPELEGIEILINNAGTIEEEKAIKVNLEGYINIAEKYAFQPNIKAVVNVGSIAAKTGLDTLKYCASQGGRNSYTKNLAIRLGHLYNIPVNSVGFGATHTTLEAKLYERDDLMQAVADESLLRKWATPEEAAEWIYFVAVHNKSMTGQNILIDNGEEANYNFIEWR